MTTQMINITIQLDQHPTSILLFSISNTYGTRTTNNVIAGVINSETAGSTPEFVLVMFICDTLGTRGK